MKIVVSSDSAIDIQQDLLDKYNIHVVPFTVKMGDEVKLDGQIDIKKMYEYCDTNKQLPKTSAVNSEQFKEYFSELLKDNDAVIHLEISSQMSSAYNNAVNAAKELNNVYVIDSGTLSTGIALLAIYASELAQEGRTPEEIVELVEKRKKYVQASFVLDKLEYLKMGGRCSSVLAFGAKMLCLHPHIIVADGAMTVLKKYIGIKMDSMVNKYCRETLTSFNRPDKHMVFITHSFCEPSMIEVAKKAIKNIGFENVYVTTANATVCSHCGKNTLGILYFNDGDELTEKELPFLAVNN